MEYQLRIPALFGDIIPLICVAEAKARRDATAGGTAFHEPCFDGRRRQYVDDLLDEARLGNLKVCNQIGSPRTLNEMPATENPVTVMRYIKNPDWEKLRRENPPTAEGVWDFTGVDLGPSEIDWSMTHIGCLYATLKSLNKWAKKRGDEFTISKDSVEWIDERGVMGLAEATTAKVEVPSDVKEELKASEQDAHGEKRDIKTERGCRRQIRENWTNIQRLYGDNANGWQVRSVLKIHEDLSELKTLKTVRNCLKQLRNEKLIP